MLRWILPLAGTVSLGLLAAFATGKLLSELDAPRAEAASVLETAADPPGEDRAARGAPGRTQRPSVYYEAIAARPLFAPTRRPPAAVAPALEVVNEAVPAAPIVAPPTLTLIGVMRGTARPSALIATDGGDPEWIAEGALVEGWTLMAVEASGVTLTRDAETYELELTR